MTKSEYLQHLRDLLACLPAEQVEESVAFYAEAIDDRIEDGMTEADAVAAMGAPSSVAETILDDLPAVPRAIVKTRRRSTLLLLVLALVGSPIWLSLGIAFIAVALAVYVCIWMLALCVWMVAAVLVIAVPALTILALDGAAIGHFAYAITMLGSALGLLGAGLLVGAGARTVSKLVAHLSVLWVRKAASPFFKRPNSGVTGGGKPKSPMDAIDGAPSVATA